jgi:MYXO-CTERM domain-containing protein
VIWALPTVALAATLDGLPSIVGPGPGQMITEAAPAGDLDGDGIGDLALASPWEDAAGHESGAVWLAYDVASIEPFTPIADVAVRLAGEAPQDHAGMSIAALGDTSGDGLDDLAVGAPDATVDTPLVGRVYVVLGGDRQADGTLGDEITLAGADRWQRLGSRVFGPGDVDGDGFAEILLGSPYPTPGGELNPGWMAILWGEAGGPPDGERIFARSDLTSTSTSADGAWVLPQSGSMLGRAAGIVPDQTGDGRPEILVGAPGFDPDATGYQPGATSTGTAVLFPMPPRFGDPVVLNDDEVLGLVRGVDDDDALPWLIEPLGDGRIALSSPSRNEGTGVVYLLDDIPEDARVDEIAVASWLGSARGDFAGWGLAATHDLTTGPILAVGRPGAADSLGAVTLAGEGTDPLEIAGCWAGGRAGWSVRSSPGPDPSGEDRAWIAITAPWASVDARNDGLTYVLTAEGLGRVDVDCDGRGWAEGRDDDGDGFLAAVDCDDAATWRNPGAQEVCSDGADDDCDGSADEDCGPAPEECGCATGSAGGIGAVAIAALFVLRRRARPLWLLGLAGSAQAADHDALDASFARLWGATGHAELQGPVAAGDYDGDGTIDVAVANYRGIEGYYATGTVHAVSGRELQGDVDLAVADVLYGDSEHDYLGVSLVTIPGSSPDGPDGLLVGVDHTGLTEEDAGTAVVWRSPLEGPARTIAADADAIVRGDDNGDGFGHRVDSGDFDGDGSTDVVVAAPWRDGMSLDRQGRVWIVNGGVSGETAGRIGEIATGSVLGSGESSWAGWSVLVPGDLDQDGLDDLLVGSLGSEPAFSGRVHFFSGATRGGHLTIADATGSWGGSQADGLVGYAMDAADGPDGRPRVVVGAPTFGDGGEVWLLDEAPVGLVDIETAAVATYTGTRGAAAGRSVAIGPGVLVAEPEADRVVVLDLDLLPIAALVGGDGLGASVAWVPDLDGDAAADAVVVAPKASGERELQGAAALISGGPLLAGTLPPAGGSRIDIDGDGVLPPDDCDDGDPRRHPEHDEVCGNGIDEDCDGQVDDECGGRGCATGTSAGFVVIGIAALAALSRRRWLVLLALPGCWQAPPADLSLRVPDDPAYGVVEVSARGAFDRIVIALDGEEVVGGPGPEVTWTWDTRETPDGEHLLRATGWDGPEPVHAWREISVAQAAGDAADPTVAFLSPREADVISAGDDVRILLDATDDVGLAKVEVRRGDQLMARLPPEGPWELLWENPDPGNYSLDAVVIDQVGKEAFASVRISVEEPAEDTASDTDTDAP